MYKELKYSLVKSLYFAHEISQVLISKNYRQIYTKMSTKFGRASDQSIVLSFTWQSFPTSFISLLINSNVITASEYPK